MLVVFSMGSVLLLHHYLPIYLFKQQILSLYGEPGTMIGTIGKMRLGDCGIFPFAGRCKTNFCILSLEWP